MSCGGGASSRRALEAGFDRHLTKPTDPAELERLFTF
jgi:CheY-like chemotaxis protein